MKIIFDEDTPAPLKLHLLGHHVTTVPQMGWAGVKNGVLLGLIQEADFDVFLTCDQNVEYQQNLTGRPFATIVFDVSDKRMKTLLPLVPKVLALLNAVQPGTVYHMGETASEKEE